ncbi:MAG: hypothetical protein M1828_002736 [Chrysothrix sp. TS-e1954]|nr:MAG: hypothetical protein M1828_002736 [Chrysothrix sp. TS-e1954]
MSVPTDELQFRLHEDPRRYSLYDCSYVSQPEKNHLATFDVHLPFEGDSDEEPTPYKSGRDLRHIKEPGRLWIIYIHGGAWRDPLRTSRDIEPSLSALQNSKHGRTRSIAGVVSLNYSLTAHPDFPKTPDEDGKSAVHPQHIYDVVNALNYLDKTFKIGNDYILVGHSCGATLALQAFMPQTWFSKTTSGDYSSDHERKRGNPSRRPPFAPPRPRAIVCLNGVYDLKKLVLDPGDKHAAIKPVYRDFVTRAFGPEETAWDVVSPTAVILKADDDNSPLPVDQKDSILVSVAWSQDDSLVPDLQGASFLEALQSSEKLQRIGLGPVIARKDVTRGDHNVAWEHGEGEGTLADIVLQTIERLSLPVST